MNDMTSCGNYEALIAYVYDECEPAEREAIAAHLVLCATCTDEIQALRDTRAHLGAWSPPSLPLGFQITRTESDTPSGRVPPKPRFGVGGWRQPLPAWAQVAAAGVIFVAGMSVNGGGSSREAPAAVAQAPASQPVPVTRSVDDMTVTRAEFARLEARLRSMESGDVQLASRTGRAVDQDELLARVSALVDDRIAQSQRQNLRWIATVENRLDDTRGAMEEELVTYKQDIRRALPSLAVRVSTTGDR